MNSPQEYMTQDGTEALAALCLPHWAVSAHPPAPAPLQVGAVLETKDGRRFGNALLFYTDAAEENPTFKLITDMGNTLTFTSEEVGDGFHPPRFVCCVACGVTDRTRTIQQEEFILSNYDVAHHPSCSHAG